MLDHALKLLEERAKELDPVEVLDVLPANMPIKQLRGFLDQVVPNPRMAAASLDSLPAV